jgi:hypothetical protein
VAATPNFERKVAKMATPIEITIRFIEWRSSMLQRWPRGRVDLIMPSTFRYAKSRYPISANDLHSCSAATNDVVLTCHLGASVRVDVNAGMHFS